MVFSTNQVRQLFVVKAIQDPQNPGDCYGVVIPGIGGDTSKPAHYFKSMNALGELVKSDYIIDPQTRHINITAASDLRVDLPQKKVTNSLIAGTDYTDGDVFYINFTFPAYISLTNEEDMTKTVAMRYNYNDQGVLYTSETYHSVTLKDNWAAQMAQALDLAFNARQNTDNSLIYVGFDGAASDKDNVIILAKEPKWRRGTMENRVNDFYISNLTFENRHDATLSTLPLENNSRVSVYGSVTDQPGTSITGVGLYFTDDTSFEPAVDMGDGCTIADLEYFCMGERGDVYRMKNWPNVVYTNYLVDPTAEYDVVDIHHYYQGEGTNDDKSEKVTTLVFEVPLSGSGKTGGMTKTKKDQSVTSLLEDVFSATDKVAAFWELMTTGEVSEEEENQGGGGGQ